MSLNNFNRIKFHLNFEEGYFYYLQLLRRKKDNPDAKSVKVIRNFYIENEDYYWDIQDTVQDLCDFFNARAYIRLNRRSYRQTALKNLKQCADYIADRQYKAVMRSFSKAAGRYNAQNYPLWIIDIDQEDRQENPHIYKDVESKIIELQDNIQKDYKIKGSIPTPNGTHIISNPFNVKEFKEDFPNLHIHKDNPTILYAPEL